MRAHADTYREDVRQRQLQRPKDEQVNNRGRPRVAGAIKGLGQYHAVCVEQKSIRNRSQAINTVRNYIWIRSEEQNDWSREKHKHQSHYAETNHVVKGGCPNRLFSALGIPRA